MKRISPNDPRILNPTFSFGLSWVDEDLKHDDEIVVDDDDDIFFCTQISKLVTDEIKIPDSTEENNNLLQETGIAFVSGSKSVRNDTTCFL